VSALAPGVPLRRFLRRARLSLGGPARARQPYLGRDHLARAGHALWVVRIYYLITLHFAFETQRNLSRLADSGRQIDPLWPVAWLDQTHFPVAATSIGLGFLASALLAAVLPERRPVRLVLAFFFVQTLALENSFGSINHYGHVGLWLALVFVALPTIDRDPIPRSRADRGALLLVVFLAQALVALFYTSSGLRKAWYGVVVPDGAVSSFAPDALPLLVVQKWLQTGAEPLFAGLFTENLWLAWPAHLLVIYVELFAVVAVFRPTLHRLWGVLLIVFHLMVWLLLGISFAYQPVLIALLLVWSPFVPSGPPDPRRVLRQLPLFGDLAAVVLRRRGSPLAKGLPT
jgi:hypothetical protein